MRSIELIPSNCCIKNICEFLKNPKSREIFTHVIIASNARISTIDSFEVACILREILPQKILLTISLSNPNPLRLILRAKNKNIHGVIIVSGESGAKCDMRECIELALQNNLSTFSATHNINAINERLNLGVQGIITQSFYNMRDMEAFLSQVSDKNRVIPSFFPFFSAKNLAKWRNNELGIHIPHTYKIEQNANLLREFLGLPHCHISMLNSNFAPLLALF